MPVPPPYLSCITLVRERLLDDRVARQAQDPQAGSVLEGAQLAQVLDQVVVEVCLHERLERRELFDRGELGERISPGCRA